MFPGDVPENRVVPDKTQLISPPLDVPSPSLNQSSSPGLADNVRTALQKHFWFWGVVLVSVALVFSVIRDLRMRLWLDEIFTIYMARQPNITQIIKATREGCDGAPPLYAIIVHWLLPIVRNEALAARLPSTLGFCCMMICVLAVCRRRLAAIYAVIAMMFVWNTSLYYASEGRSYGMVLGCGGIALLSWQMATERRRRPLAITLFAGSLSFMVALHYYAIFFLVPFFVAELVRAWEFRKPDLAILAAMLPPVFIVILHYPLIVAWRPYLVHFYSPANPLSFWPFYEQYLTPFLPACLFALLLFAVLPEPVHHKATEFSIPKPEGVAICILVLMPVFVAVAAVYTTHAFVLRYVLWTTMGFGLLAAAGFSNAEHSRIGVGVGILGLMVGSLLLSGISALTAPPELRFGNELASQEIKTLPDSADPIVIPSASLFVELSYYSEPPLRSRLVFLEEPDLAVKYWNTDTSEYLLAALAPRIHFRVEDVKDILRKYPRFIVVATRDDFLIGHLLRLGYKVTPSNAINPPKDAINPPILYEVIGT